MSGRPRKWLRFLSVGIATALVPVVVVAGPARAFVEPITVRPTAAAAIALAGETATAGRLVTSLNPWGLAINTVLAGVGLYTTRDSWLPYVTGLFGQDNTTPSAPAPTAPPGSCYMSMGWETLPTGSGTQSPAPRVQLGSPGCTIMWNQISITMTRVCKSSLDGSITTVTVTDDADGSQALDGFSNYTAYRTLGLCGSQYSAVGYRLQAAASIGGGYLAWDAGVNDISDLQFSTTVKCINAAGTQVSVTLSGYASAGIPVPSCESRLGEGWHGEELEISGGRPGQSPKDLLYRAVPDSETYAQCVGPTAACTLRLLWNGQPCTSAIDECVTWATRYPTNATEYQCKWGNYNVPIADCAVLERAYSPGGTVVRDPTEVDGDPATGTQPTPAPTTTSNPAPTPSPMLGDPPPEPNPPPESVPGENDACWPAGWGLLNPASWVLRPIKCALRWAFVPSVTGVQGPLTQMRTDLGGSTPGLWVGALEDLGNEFSYSESGCAGPSLEWQGVTMQPFSACAEPMATVAGICKLLMGAAMAVFGGLACIRAVGSGFSWSPGVGE